MTAFRTAILMARLIRPRLIERPLWRWRHRNGLPPADPADLRSRLSYGAEPDWLDRFSEAHTAAFGLSLARRSSYLDSPAWREGESGPLLKRADNCEQNIFEVLGSGPVKLAEPIDWRLDFKSGHRFPDALAWRIDYRDEGRNSDVKVPWEVARFHCGLWLGQAYWLTGDEKYSRAFARLASGWLAANPPGRGIHWANPMELAIRSINWSWSLGFFRGSAAVPDTMWAELLASLLWHGRVIRANLEYGRRLGNHYISDLAGLFVLGILFRETAEGRRWLGFARRKLEQQIRWQVHPDGVSYEKSVSYHRLVAELFLVVLALARRNGVSMSEGYVGRLTAMLEFANSYSREDGSTPLVGDADDGRVLPFAVAEPLTSHRHLLGAGGALLGRPDLMAAGTLSDALWLLGPEAVTSPAAPRAARSAAYPAGGFYLMRGTGCHTFLDGGPLGFENDLIHGHLDTLSLEVSAPGGVFLSDSGCYAYTSDVAANRAHAETQAHNTVRVDGEDIEVLDRIWRVKADRTRPRVLRWSSVEGLDEWEAEHEGYARLPDPVRHRRRVRFESEQRRWSITDSLEGRSEHDLELYWHCAIGVKVEPVSATEFLLQRAGGVLGLRCSIGLEIEQGWVAPSYGVRHATPVLVGRWRGPLPAEITTELHWEPAAPLGAAGG